MKYYNDLYHTGVLGMRWGHRRAKVSSDVSSTHTAKSEKESSKKNVKNMSDDELKKIVNRLQMERQYSQLSPKKLSKGKEFVDKTIKAGQTFATVTTTGLTIYNNIGKIKDIVEKTKK